MLGLQKDAYALNIHTDDTVNSTEYADDRYGQALSIIRNFSAIEWQWGIVIMSAECFPRCTCFMVSSHFGMGSSSYHKVLHADCFWITHDTSLYH
jgi:hypothetical protein